MSVDLRGFDYPLEPVLQRQRWRLDALQARLGRLQRHLSARERMSRDLQDQHAQVSRDFAASPNRMFNPETHTRTLSWLVQLQARLAEVTEELLGLESDRRALIALCNGQRCKVEAIEAHRDRSIGDFTREESGRLAAVADRDWLARSLHPQPKSRAPCELES